MFTLFADDYTYAYTASLSDNSGVAYCIVFQGRYSQLPFYRPCIYRLMLMTAVFEQLYSPREVAYNK